MNKAVPRPPIANSELRQLRFQHDQHHRTRPLAEAMLFLNPVFPWSFRSQQSLRKYVVTEGGYLIKVQTDGFPIPTRAFRLRDCLLLEGLPRDGQVSFAIKGANCCRDYISIVTDRRTEWWFRGTERQVTLLLAAIRMQVPWNSYRPVNRPRSILSGL